METDLNPSYPYGVHIVVMAQNRVKGRVTVISGSAFRGPFLPLTPDPALENVNVKNSLGCF